MFLGFCSLISTLPKNTGFKCSAFHFSVQSGQEENEKSTEKQRFPDLISFSHGQKLFSFFSSMCPSLTALFPLFFLIHCLSFRLISFCNIFPFLFLIVPLFLIALFFCNSIQPACLRSGFPFFSPLCPIFSVVNSLYSSLPFLPCQASFLTS